MRSVQTGRIVHALLFTGPAGTGKRTAAIRFAQSVYCTGSLKPCGVCPACKRVSALSHPDVHIVEPLPNKRSILTDDIRTLLEKLALRPYEGQMHTAIIDPADSMTEQAQNALLKTLEEPRGEVLFILISSSASALLPTVVSRCRTIRFAALSVDECAEALTRKGLSADRALKLAGIAEGRLDRALELDKDERLLKLREDVLTMLDMAAQKRASLARMANIADIQKGDEQTVLDFMQLWARDLMAVQNGAEPYEKTDLKRLKDSRLNGSKLLRTVVGMRRMLSSNVSWNNVLTQTLIELYNSSCG